MNPPARARKPIPCHDSSMADFMNPHAALAPLPEPLAHFARGVELPDPMDAPALRWGIIGAGGIAGTFGF